MPSILALQHERNMIGLETASYARQAELALGQQSASINQGYTERALQAQMSGIPSGGSIALGGLVGLASQTVPFLLANRPTQQATSVFPQGSYGRGFNVGSYTFGNSSSSAPVNIPSNFYNNPVMQDVPREIRYYG
jgi:hypothetical protein